MHSTVEPSAGFPPVAADDARILILGTLPGRESLRQQQYYAQPRNAFWRILGELGVAGPGLAYAERLKRLTQARLALWDVCAQAVRPGSLDASIDLKSLKANELRPFLAAHPSIVRICLNGQGAARLFERYLAPTLAPHQLQIERRVLPSTSPAHARLTFAAKRSRWAAALNL